MRRNLGSLCSLLSYMALVVLISWLLFRFMEGAVREQKDKIEAIVHK